MSIEEEVRKAGSAQEALVEIAKGLDKLMSADALEQLPPQDAWDKWDKQMDAEERSELGLPPEDVRKDGPADAVDSEPEAKEHEIPAVLDEEGADSRAHFASTTLNLAEALSESDFDPVEVYVKGGPTWLHSYNRELVLSYPRGVRKQLVQDLMRNDPDRAGDLARDILKETSTSPSLLS